MIRFAPRIPALLRLGGVCALGLVVFLGHATAQYGQSEYAVKAAFVFRFMQFVEWPDHAFAGSSSPLVVGVLGTDPFGTKLRDALEGRSIGGRRVAIVKLAAVSANVKVHVLFVPDYDGNGPDLSSFEGKAVLLIGESPGFARKLGHINFVLEDNRIAFEIHGARARASGLSISSRLLQLGRAPG